MPAGASKSFKTVHDGVARTVHALVERLHRQVRPVAVHDEARQQIGFGKNQAAGFRIFDHVLAMGDRRGEAAAKERDVGWFGVRREHPQRDLRFGTVVSDADEAAASSALRLALGSQKLIPRLRSG